MRKLNNWLSEQYIMAFRYFPFVQVILLHKIYDRRDQIRLENGTIGEGMDISQFEYFIKYFTKRGYQFVDEADIISGNIDNRGRSIYLTFDDGYFNNFKALKILQNYNAKATFFISTNHVKEQKCFWWDVLAREGVSEGLSEAEIEKQNVILCQLKWEEQEEQLSNKYGKSCFDPRSDIERPMTELELQKFANNDLVTIGNHTHNHLNLLLYSKREIQDSIKEAESYLNDLIGVKTESISYPYGFFEDSTVEIVKESGYKVGITTIGGQHDPQEALLKKMSLKRNQLCGHIDIEAQCRNIHVNYSLKKAVLGG